MHSPNPPRSQVSYTLSQKQAMSPAHYPPFNKNPANSNIHYSYYNPYDSRAESSHYQEHSRYYPPP